MNNIEELKQKMLSLIEEDEEFAAYIGRTSRSIQTICLQKKATWMQSSASIMHCSFVSAHHGR